MAKDVKYGRILAPIVILAAVFGGRYGYQHGWFGPAGASSSSVPQLAPLPDLAASPEVPANPASVAELPLPSSAPAAVAGPEIRSAHMAWNSQMALCYANGGPATTRGSLMEKHGVNLKLIRENDTSKMQSELINFAKALKKGDPQPKAGYHFMSVMGDGSAATIAGMADALKDLGPDYAAEIIGSAGYSRGEDKLMGPKEWLVDPKLARGSLVAVFLRDGDWNIVIKWAFDNQIKVNPNEKTYDPSAINFYATDDFVKAGDAYIAGACDDRPVVIDGRRIGETKHVCVNAMSSWTPVDVNVAKKRGGIVKIVSTKEYSSQMPNVIIGIKKWDQENRKSVVGFLSAMYEAGDQVKVFPAALKRASEASWEVYQKEETPDYWLKYYKGVTEPDRTGLMVELGGSSVNNMQDALSLFGMLPGSANRLAATYTVFGDFVKQQYPKLVPSYPPIGDVQNNSFLAEAAKDSQSKTVADAPVFQATTEIKAPVSSRSWAINFDTGKATFTPGSLKTLQNLRDQLLVADSLKISISGHTDNTGDPANNLALSKARAEAVRAWLIQQSPSAFPPARFAGVNGYGDTQPLPNISNDTEAGRSLNRRVEITTGTN